MTWSYKGESLFCLLLLFFRLALCTHIANVSVAFGVMCCWAWTPGLHVMIYRVSEWKTWLPIEKPAFLTEIPLLATINSLHARLVEPIWFGSPKYDAAQDKIHGSGALAERGLARALLPLRRDELMVMDTRRSQIPTRSKSPAHRLLSSPSSTSIALVSLFLWVIHLGHLHIITLAA
jgi:hypothetical protein